jgi:hypothetical protein
LWVTTRDVAQGPVAAIMFGPPGEDRAHERRAGRRSAEGELVFGGEPEAIPHIVMQARLGEKEAEELGSFGLGAQEGVRISDLIPVRKGETLVHGEEILEMRRATAPGPKHEDRRMHDRIEDRSSIVGLLATAIQ